MGERNSVKGEKKKHYTEGRWGGMEGGHKKVQVTCLCSDHSR